MAGIVPMAGKAQKCYDDGMLTAEQKEEAQSIIDGWRSSSKSIAALCAVCRPMNTDSRIVLGVMREIFAATDSDELLSRPDRNR